MNGELKIISGAALFALIPVGVKLAEGSNNYLLLSGRLLVASVVIFILAKNKRNLFSVNGKQLLRLMIWAVLMLGAMLCYFQSIRLSGVAISAALLGTQPVLIIVLAAILLKERIGALSIFCAALSMAGLYLVSDTGDLSQGNGLGKLLAIISAILLSLIFIFQKKYLTETSSEKLVFYQCLFQIPFLLPFVFAGKVEINLSLCEAWLLLGVVCTAFSYYLIYSGVKTVAAQKIGVLQSIEFVLPVFIGMMFYKEPLKAKVLAGVVLILFSGILIQYKRKKLKMSSAS